MGAGTGNGRDGMRRAGPEQLGSESLPVPIKLSLRESETADADKNTRTRIQTRVQLQWYRLICHLSYTATQCTNCVVL